MVTTTPSLSLVEMVVVEIAAVSCEGEADLDADLDPVLDLGDRDLDLLSGEAVLEATLLFFSFLNKLSTFLFLALGLFSFLILDISFCSSRVFFCRSLTLSS